MKDAQSVAEVTLDAVVNGEMAPKRARKWRVHQQRVRKLQREYRSGQRTVAQYWDAVSHLVAAFL